MSKQRCSCGTQMDGPTTTSTGLLEFRCPGCRRTVTRAEQTNERTRVQFGAGKRVLRWL